MFNLRTAVLRGGPSEEHEVSIQTGRAVLDALEIKKIPAKDIIINKQGEWLSEGFVREPQTALAGVDVVFIALHGSDGEDGTVQRLLDRFHIPYTGSKPYPSAIAMNKLLTKEKLRDSGISMHGHIKVVREGTDPWRVATSVSELFGPEYVIKPLSSGSSIGVKMVSGVSELGRALHETLEIYPEVMVEEKIRGREATVGVVERFRNQDLYRLPVIEIVPPVKAGYFSNQVKYNGETEEICPGRFSRREKDALEEAAHKAHQLLELSQYSRSDFIVSPSDIYFLETNTLPGMTAESLLPKALQAVGCKYEDFVTHLLEDALAKHKPK